jgi:hypothetical protein
VRSRHQDESADDAEERRHTQPAVERLLRERLAEIEAELAAMKA